MKSALRTSRRIHVLSPVGPDECRIVQVAPIVDVVGEEIGGDAELFHSEQLALRHILIVLEPVPCGEFGKKVRAGRPAI